jgi:hypothetical protein
MSDADITAIMDRSKLFQVRTARARAAALVNPGGRVGGRGEGGACAWLCRPPPWGMLTQRRVCVWRVRAAAAWWLVNQGNEKALCALESKANTGGTSKRSAAAKKGKGAAAAGGDDDEAEDGGGARGGFKIIDDDQGGGLLDSLAA